MSFLPSSSRDQDQNHRHKRTKRTRSSSPVEPSYDLFGAQTLTNQFQSTFDPILLPTAYEVTLSHRPQSIKQIEWLAQTGPIQTDRFDVLHLVSQIQPHPDQKQRQDDEEGWSDLASDTEDTFFLNPLDLSFYLDSKRRIQIQQQLIFRIGLMSTPTTTDTTTDTTALTRSQFQLMQRTARILSKSSNPALLQVKILANHGSDARFSFLRSGIHQQWGDVWSRLLSQGADSFHFEDVSPNNNNNDTNQPTAAASHVLVSYDDSDSDSDQQPPNPDPPPSELSTEQEKKIQRLQRAKQWILQRNQNRLTE